MAYVCAICDLSLSTADAVIVSRGKKTLIEKSKYLDDELWKKIENIRTVRIHEKCRKIYLIKKKESLENIDSSQCSGMSSGASLRSCNVSEKFDFKSQCLFCTEECNKSANKKSNRNFRVVTTLQIKNNIERQCGVQNNELARQVYTRINSSIDLVAAEGRYHKLCHDNFFKPLKVTPPGRPSDKLCDKAFSSLCSYINDNLEMCQFSLNDLHEKMESYLPTENKDCMWSKTYLKGMLIACYQDRINTAQVGTNLILTFKEYAEKILSDQWYNSRNKDEESECVRIITAAAKILRENIRRQVYEINTYPTNSEFQNGGQDCIPDNLKIFLRTLFNQTSSDKENLTTERKMVSLSNAIIAIIRPKSYISPVLLGLGIHLHRKFGSKDLLSILHALGFVSHYKSVMLYENTAAELSVNVSSPSFIQFAFDNADFNIRTLDGFGTFHAMGGVMVVTPEKAMTIDPLHKTPQNQLQVGQFGTAPIVAYHKPPILGLSKITVEKLCVLKPESLRVSSLLNCLWAYGQMNNFQPNSSWQGYMSAKIQSKGSQEVSKVVPLPFVNLDPSNPTAIYSSLVFALKLCKKFNMKTCIATFDQPLFVKATEIVLASNPTDDLSQVVVRLGTFHLIMSFMGAIGFTMSGSGLEELWATVYAGNSIPHLINGHAYSRALRAHLLTQSALTQLLFLKNTGSPEYCKNDLEELYNPDTQIENVNDHLLLNRLLSNFEEIFKTTEASHRTAKLWCQYWNQVEILKMTIKADRTADWDLHLYCASSMLPYFHAAGHLPYAKSCHLYVQNMLACKHSMHPEDYRRLTKEDCNVVRRNDKYWSGTPLDMIIEQELMRRMKTSGGLTHGRGITDSTLSRWISGMPQCLQVSEALENFSGVITLTSEQHVELRSSRIERDQQDLRKLFDWLEIRNPFNPDIKELMSISSGVVANSDVNCDKAAEIGEKVISRIIGTNYNVLRLKRNDKVRSLLSGSSSVKINGEQKTVDPALLFSRILCSASSPEEIKQCFKYELAAWSPSLFDNGLLRKTSKSTLYKLFDKLHPPLLQNPNSITHYVIDGGHLLHKVVWQNPAIFSDVFSQYYNYIKYHYGQSVTVVFDGYEEMQTKIVEQNRRSSGKKMVPIVSFSNLSAVKIPKADFLSNSTNKSNFIRALGKMLVENGINVKFADGDADTLIVTTAVAISDNFPEGAVAVVSDDTDIMVLLIHYCQKRLFMIRPGKLSKPNKVTNISALQQRLGDLKDVILSVHAMTGCDTTSAVFNKGKINLVNTVQRKRLCNILKEFYNPHATKEKLEEITTQFFIAAYVKSVPQTPDLDSVRYTLYQQYVAKRSLNTNFNLASLPPTSNSAKYHGFRVFHQVQAWLNNNLPPQDWGWILKNGNLHPIHSDQAMAPTWVLQKIFCNCSSGGCKKACRCKRMGLSCSMACGQCNGITCMNPTYVDADEDSF
ncbi:hypothetical protein PPYR_08132 [Photinus pyralis]|uniref:Tesmin/TSO1-like CXC domain-containing protein n=2 Tax=Photinus pyralis TaxID=7054 RepID=A0A5N4AIU9_PHOPY|nr:hypothetical protein PPYR_08132 [Photinus pyralis]